MVPAACRPIIKCGKTGCAGLCPLSVVESGKKPATCRTCGKTFPRPDVALSDFLPARGDKKKSNSIQHVPAEFSGSDSPREQSAPSGDDTESHQSEINKKIKANNKLRKILTNMPQEHRLVIYSDSFKSKMQSLEMRKQRCCQPNGNSYPCKVGLKNKRIIWSESRKRSRRNSRNVWKSGKSGSRLTRNWKQPTPNRPKVADQTTENAKAVNQGTPEVQSHTTGSTRDQAAQRTILSVSKSALSMHCMGCHSVSELMAAGATDEDVRKSARLWHKQCGNWKQGGCLPNQDSRLTVSRARWWVRVKSSPLASAYLDSAKWTSRAKAMKRSLSNAFREKRRLAKKRKQKGEGL